MNNLKNYNTFLNENNQYQDQFNDLDSNNYISPINDYVSYVSDEYITCKELKKKNVTTNDTTSLNKKHLYKITDNCDNKYIKISTNQGTNFKPWFLMKDFKKI